MYLSGTRLRQLEYLQAVVRTGHFGAAADDMGVSQPALSQGLRRLEESVGAPLFKSEGRHKSLTPLGRDVAEYAAEIIATTDAFVARIAARQAGTSGKLSVGLIDAVALYVAAHALAVYRSQHPDVDLQLRVDGSERLLDDLSGGRLDVAVVVAPAPGFTSQPLADESLNVYGPPIDRLDDVDHWVLYPTGSHTRAAIDAAFVERGLRPRVDAESGNPSVLAQLVRLGAGWTVLPDGIANASPNSLPVVERTFATRSIVIARRADSQADALIDGFVDVLETAQPA